MIASLVYLALALGLGFATVGTFYPRILGLRLASAVSLAATITTLAAPVLIPVSVVVTAVAWRLGAMEHALGLVALAIQALCWATLGAYLWRVHRALPVLDGSTVEDHEQPFSAELTDDERHALLPCVVSWWPALLYRVAARVHVDVTRGVVYRIVDGRRLRLDVYRPREVDGPRPTAVYIHGGGWVMGNRRQSAAMMYELAAAGWVVFAISYRLAPRHPLPAAVEDCKAAVAWARENAADYGGREGAPVVMGGSAGGHLAALTALTPNAAEFQPGFEDADTRVRGAVVLYGVTDFEGAFGERPHTALAILLERWVLRARFQATPDVFRRFQASSYVSADAPPILLVHGTHDEVVPLAESRRFRDRLEAAGARSVHLLEVPLGLHAFEVAPSPLHQRAVRVILRFMDSVARRAE